MGVTAHYQHLPRPRKQISGQEEVSREVEFTQTGNVRNPLRLGLFAVASLAVFLAHPLRETLESELGVFDFGLSLPPSLLGAGLDLFFQHLRGLGAGFRVMAQFLGGANHESAKKTHLRMHPV